MKKLLVTVATGLLLVTGTAAASVQSVASRAVHGNYVLVTKAGTTTVAVDRGRVTAVSATSITLQRPDGQSVTLVVNAATKAPNALKVGARVAVFSRSGVAIAIRGARASAQLLRRAVHADLMLVVRGGSVRTVTYDRGRIEAKTETSITLKRRDGVTVTFALNAQTKARGKVEAGRVAAVLSQNGTATHVVAGRVAARS